MPELTRKPGLARAAAPVGPAEYPRVVARVREAVAEAVPPGAIVLVISRGDEELVRFPDHRGWHFPRTAEGEYAGYHPLDGAAAIAHLEELRAAGAGWLVIPCTAFWWLEYYGELAEHLERVARRVVDGGDACLLFAFQGAPSPVRMAPASRSRPSATPTVAGRLPDLVDALLPENCSVAVAVSGYEPLPTLGARAVWRLVLPEPSLELGGRNGKGPGSQLEALAAAGVAYLVVPADVEGVVRLEPWLRDHMNGSGRLISRQRHLGAIYRLEAGETGMNGGTQGSAGEVPWP